MNALKEKRTIALLAVLLMLVAGVVLRPHLEALFSKPAGTELRVLPGENKITGVQVLLGKDGLHTARVEYFYRGDQGPSIWLGIQTDARKGTQWSGGGGKSVAPGQGVVDIEMLRPNDEKVLVTRKVSAAMGPFSNPLVVHTIDHVIEWPDTATYFANRALAGKTSEQLYEEAVRLIDEGSSRGVVSARQMLEKILLKEPGYAPAQIEMARVAMKTNWGPEGLRQAEQYLDAVLATDAANANAQVLRGYVHVHQKRYKDAEADFINAAAARTKNLWLWANWGQMLELQGKDEAAIEKYREAVAGERSYDTYDRARLEAYRHLFALLDKRKRFDEIDTLHQRRVAEFSKMPCLRIEHAMYRLSRQAEPTEVVTMAAAAMEGGCSDSHARATLGAAHYVAWAGQQGEVAAKSLAQAQVFLPEGPWLFYTLAGNDATAKIIPRLVAKGTPINIKDNEKFNALAHALGRGDLDVAKRLMRLGSRPTELVGEDPYPAAFIPLMNQDLAGVNLMQAQGVNYAKLKWRGVTGLEIAKRMPNAEILKSLERGSAGAI
jgi:tetratricopeptide (TPR) repeat protein